MASASRRALRPHRRPRKGLRRRSSRGARWSYTALGYMLGLKNRGRCRLHRRRRNWRWRNSASILEAPAAPRTRCRSIFHEGVQGGEAERRYRKGLCLEGRAACGRIPPRQARRRGGVGAPNPGRIIWPELGQYPGVYRPNRRSNHAWRRKSAMPRKNNQTVELSGRSRNGPVTPARNCRATGGRRRNARDRSEA